MKYIALLSFLLNGLAVVTCALGFPRQFHFVNVSLSWSAAQRYCREHHTDLATVSNTEEMKQLSRPPGHSGPAWIGLRSAAVGYQKWGPHYDGTEDECAGLDQTGEWGDRRCSHEEFFVCYNYSVKKSFHLFTAQRDYDNAQAFCRGASTDLALIESEEENQRVISLMSPMTFAWIHEPRRRWAWSDNSTSTFMNWGEGRPLEVQRYSCAAEDQKHSWKDVSCDLRLPFFCHHDEEITGHSIKVSFHSDLDLSDAKNYNMLLKKIEKELNQPGVKALFKSPPQKRPRKKDEL